MTGWALSLKTKADSNAGKNWYWYEVFSVTDGSSPVASALGVGFCVACHTPGKDYVLTPFPLN